MTNSDLRLLLIEMLKERVEDSHPDDEVELTGLEVSLILYLLQEDK